MKLTPEQEEIRKQAKQWHKMNSRSAHNPYHPRNGSVAMALQRYMNYHHWYEIADVNEWNTHSDKCQMLIRERGFGVEALYSGIGQRSYRLMYSYLPEDEMWSSYKSIMEWIDTPLFEKYDESHKNDNVWHIVGLQYAPKIHLIDVNNDMEYFKNEHDINLIAADNAWLKMMQDKVSGE